MTIYAMRDGTRHATQQKYPADVQAMNVGLPLGRLNSSKAA